MSDAIIVTIISSGVTLLGTIVAVITNAIKTRRENNNHIKRLEEKIDRHIAEDEKQSATACRARILRFANDVRHGDTFTKEYWDAILMDVTFYNVYTSEHPDFRNNVCSHAINLLEDKYDECMNVNGFAV